MPKLNNIAQHFGGSILPNINNIARHFGVGSIIVIVITFVLFFVALFVKGFTHDLLVEVAVFLVSVKLILITYSNSLASRRLEEKLDHIEEKIDILLTKEDK